MGSGVVPKVCLRSRKLTLESYCRAKVHSSRQKGIRKIQLWQGIQKQARTVDCLVQWPGEIFDANEAHREQERSAEKAPAWPTALKCTASRMEKAAFAAFTYEK